MASARPRVRLLLACGYITTAKRRRAIEKDSQIVAAALSASQRIASLDEAARTCCFHFQPRFACRQDPLGEPEISAETVVEWIRHPVPNERKRTLEERYDNSSAKVVKRG